MARFYSVEELAYRLAVTPKTISRLIQKNDVRTVHMGGSTRISEEELLKIARPNRPNLQVFS